MEPTTLIGIAALLVGFGVYVIKATQSLVETVADKQSARGLDSKRVSQLENDLYTVKSKDMHDLHLDKLEDFSDIQQMCDAANASLSTVIERTGNATATQEVQHTLNVLNQHLDVLADRIITIQKRQSIVTKKLLDKHFVPEGEDYD
ncbi:MAG: hypothetical protein ACPICB_00415 [Candidatus Poseidoniaceae archaeon]